MAAIGCGTVGLLEAVMLAGQAFKRIILTLVCVYQLIYWGIDISGSLPQVLLALDRWKPLVTYT